MQRSALFVLDLIDSKIAWRVRHGTEIPFVVKTSSLESFGRDMIVANELDEVTNVKDGSEQDTGRDDNFTATPPLDRHLCFHLSLTTRRLEASNTPELIFLRSGVTASRTRFRVRKQGQQSSCSSTTCISPRCCTARPLLHTEKASLVDLIGNSTSHTNNRSLIRLLVGQARLGLQQNLLHSRVRGNVGMRCR